MDLLRTSLALGLLSSFAVAQLTVVSTSPPLNGSNVDVNPSIVVNFDRAVDAATLANFRVYGFMGGKPAGTTTLENGGQRIVFRPTRPFFAGEIVLVSMSEQLKAADGSFLRTQGFNFTFRTRTKPASMTWNEIQSFYPDPGNFVRIYGTQTTDLDGDDFLDMATVNEVSSDVRIFMNLGDGSGTFETTPTSVNPLPSEPSPNENADMNGDGLVDLVTIDAIASEVSVMLGNGDGTFQPALNYAMTNEPHGLALIDCDGDGDLDVFAACYGASRLARRLNNGDGTLGPDTYFEGGGSGEWALGGGDMNNDAIMDLVVGLRSGFVSVLLGNGDGTFQAPVVQNAGGSSWMVALGDIDADGALDVASGNSFSNSGCVLYGNANGTLQPAQSFFAPGHVPAVDIGDLDGDGDLDVVLSSYGGGTWEVFRNDSGTWTNQHTFTSPANPGCCSLADLDGDQDLDMVLVTETSDEIRIIENDATTTSTFCFGNAAACPCANAGLPGHGCENSFATGGGLLLPQGVPSVSSDSFALNVGGLPGSTSALFFQGTTQQSGGAGVAFGDGLRCAAGAVLRLGTRFCSNGYASLGAGIVGDPAISVQGAIPAAGGTRHYQAWYRNTASFCTPSGFNLSNGVTATWVP